jgi:Uma2 family endonuclease
MSIATHFSTGIDSAVAGIPADLIWRVTVEKYHEMIRSGALTENDPVELLEGWLVYKMPKSRQHTLATRHTQAAIEKVLPTGWHVESEEPITTEDSEPEPDVSVIRGSDDDYPDQPPGPEDIALLVEVADTTLDRDRGWKKRLYAKASIPVYWIVNLVDRRVEVHTEPSGPVAHPDYRRREDYDERQSVPLVIAGQQVAMIAVADLLPENIDLRR